MLKHSNFAFLFLFFQSTEAPEVQQEPVNVGTGAPEAAEKEPPAANIPTAIKYQDDNSLAHPNVSVYLKFFRQNLFPWNEK